jgi:hypothetical protein
VRSDSQSSAGLAYCTLVKTTATCTFFLRFALSFVALSFLPLSALAANEEPPPKTTGVTRTMIAPKIDGVLDEAVWEDAIVVKDMHQVKPVEYAAPSEPTQFLLLYTDNALYIGVRAFDSKPDEIRARMLRQGGGLRSEDRVKIVLDPFHDRRSGFAFLVNPNGSRFDGIYLNGDFEGDWDGIWQAESQLVADGWTSEIRIPFKTLSFNDPSEWGLNLGRDIPRMQEEIGWSSRNQQVNPAVSGTLLGMSGISQGRGLDIVPSISASNRRTYDNISGDTNVEPSLDVYYKITTGLNGSLTINTDFSATEVDNRQVNLTRFNLFFPEKRSFFLRESDIFEFGGIGGDTRGNTFRRGDIENGRPYFSRRIGLSATGAPVDLEVGGKVSGRVGGWNIGAMAIRQAEFAFVDATDILVARATMNVLEESNVGFIMTSGDPRTNLDNTLVGLDYQYRNTRLSQGRSLQANFWYQQSETDGLDGDDAAFGFQIQSPNQNKWRGGIGAKEIQDNFYPAVGFASRSGVRQYSAEAGYTYQRNGDLVRSIYSGIDAYRVNLIDGGLDTEKVLFRLLELRTDSDDEIKIRHDEQKENLSEPFEIIDDIIIPAGDYSYGGTEIELKSSENRVFNAEIKYRDGGFFDGTIQSVGAKIGWRPSKHFRIDASYKVDDVELPQGDFTTKLASVDFDIVFSNTISWVNLVQYDNVSDSIGINSRVHWAPQAGRNFFFVVNHNYVERVIDRKFHSTQTDVTLKFDYTFRF